MNAKKIWKTVCNISLPIACTLLILCFLYMLVYFGYNHTGPHRFNADTIAYKTTETEERVLLDVKQVYNEKGKEPIYVLELKDIWMDNVEIPESIYTQYIGDGNNTITVKHTTVTLAVANVDFGTSFDKAKLYSVERYQLPWETESIEFTTTEITQFYETLCNRKYGFQFEDLPFKFAYAGKGWAHTNVLERGYTCWSSQ